MLNKDKQRELCYLCTITDITPIDGADNVELVHINGWKPIDEMVKFCTVNNLEHVPVRDCYYILPDTMEEAKQDAEGYYDSSICEGHHDCKREGVVLYSSKDPHLQFKNKSLTYSLKHQEG